MEKYLFFILFSFAYVAVAYEVGDIVLYHASVITMKAKIVDIKPDGDYVELDFGNSIKNKFFGGYHSVYRHIKPYKAVESYTFYTFKPYYVGKKVTLKVGDYAKYEDSATRMKGKIVDLTENGYGKLDFENSITNNIYYGDYHSIHSHLSPYSEN